MSCGSRSKYLKKYWYCGRFLTLYSKIRKGRGIFKLIQIYFKKEMEHHTLTSVGNVQILHITIQGTMFIFKGGRFHEFTNLPPTSNALLKFTNWSLWRLQCIGGLHL
ncbi:hypothetical protein FKM82_028740 [Ascaphus truei]